MPESTGFQLSQQQKQLWLTGADESAFNSVITVALDGAVNAAKLKDAVGQVVARHEALRTTFERRPGMRVPLQIVRGTLAPAWEEIGSASASTVPSAGARRAACGSLRRGPPDARGVPVDVAIVDAWTSRLVARTGQGRFDQRARCRCPPCRVGARRRSLPGRD